MPWKIPVIKTGKEEKENPNGHWKILVLILQTSYTWNNPSGTGSFASEFYQSFKKEIILIIHKFLQKIEGEETSSTYMNLDDISWYQNLPSILLEKNITA